MSKLYETVEPDRPAPAGLSRIGIVVHPSRSVDRPLRMLREWAGEHTVDIVQVPAPCLQQQVAATGSARDCDLVVAIGGDGTTLAAIRTGAAAGRPVLGIACGSIGALTSVAAADAALAIERFSRGDWTAYPLPALDVHCGAAEQLRAFNDVAIVRSGAGQVRVCAQVDGILYARFAGDGCIVSTPLGSSAYALAAGGPLLGLRAECLLLTPVSAHGGSCPPLVADANAELRLLIDTRHGGARLEVDGQPVEVDHAELLVRLRSAVVSIIKFPDQEPFLSGLRRRRIIIDSPRILAEDSLH